MELRPSRPTVVVIRDSSAWADFVERSGLRPPSGDPDEHLPSIDFSSEMAIVLMLGARPTSGYAVRVGQVRQRGSSIAVSATETVSCSTALQVVTYPLTAVAVMQSGDDVMVDWSREVCR